MTHTRPKIMQQHSALNLKISLAALVWIFILSATCDLWNFAFFKSETFRQNMKILMERQESTDVYVTHTINF